MDAREWIEFLGKSPAELTEDEIERAEAEGYSGDWKGCPVSAMAPHVCESFRATTQRLGEILRTDGQDAWRAAYNRALPLFRAACEFGAALERLREAHEAGDDLAMADHMNEARGAWFFLATLAGDA